jgi:hypothetical protein
MYMENGFFAQQKKSPKDESPSGEPKIFPKLYSMD